MYFLRALMYSKKVFHDQDEVSDGVLRMKIFLTSVKICQIREISLESSLRESRFTDRTQMLQKSENHLCIKLQV